MGFKKKINPFRGTFSFFCMQFFCSTKPGGPTAKKKGHTPQKLPHTISLYKKKMGNLPVMCRIFPFKFSCPTYFFKIWSFFQKKTWGKPLWGIFTIFFVPKKPKFFFAQWGASSKKGILLKKGLYLQKGFLLQKPPPHFFFSQGFPNRVLKNFNCPFELPLKRGL